MMKMIWKTAAMAGLAAGLLATSALAADKTLNMIVIEGGDTTAMQAVADSYEAAHPGIKIKLQSYPFAQFFQVAELRLRSKDKGIDLVVVIAPLGRRQQLRLQLVVADEVVLQGLQHLDHAGRLPIMLLAIVISLSISLSNQSAISRSVVEDWLAE